MNALSRTAEAGGEELRAELTDVAFAIMSRYQVAGPAYERWGALWSALGPVVRRQREALGARPADLVAEAADAAYQVALDRGFRGSFLDLELDLWNGMCTALGRNRSQDPS